MTCFNSFFPCVRFCTRVILYLHDFQPCVILVLHVFFVPRDFQPARFSFCALLRPRAIPRAILTREFFTWLYKQVTDVWSLWARVVQKTIYGFLFFSSTPIGWQIPSTVKCLATSIFGNGWGICEVQERAGIIHWNSDHFLGLCQHCLNSTIRLVEDYTKVPASHYCMEIVNHSRLNQHYQSWYTVPCCFVQERTRSLKWTGTLVRLWMKVFLTLEAWAKLAWHFLRCLWWRLYGWY
jgi:hypothetical protein